MPVKFNGVDSYLELPSKIVTSYPYSIVLSSSWDNIGSALHFWAGQGVSSDSSAYAGIYFGESGAEVARDGDGNNNASATRFAAPQPTSGSMQWCVAVFTSANNRTIYYGNSSTSVTDTGVATNSLSSHNRTTIGARHYGSTADLFTKGSLAEVHWIGAALTSTDVANIVSGTDPETLTGWIDGVELVSYQSSGNYVSKTGTRTFVASGTLAASSLTHPVSRTIPDTNPPTMNGSLSSSSITSTGFTLIWIAASDDVAVTGYEYSTNSGTSYTDAGNVLTKAVTGLAPSTLYNTRVRAYDLAGNKATPLSLAVTTSAAPDVTVPTMNGSLSSSSVTSGGFTLSWSAASDNVAVTGYEYSTDNGSTYNDAGNVLTKTISGLSASTLYNTKVRAYDAAGNRATPLSLAVTTSASSDVTLPVLAGSITPSAITLTGFTISWPAGSDNVAVTGYEYSINGGTSYIDAGNVLTKAITGLTQSTAYAVRVRAYDAAGNRSTPALAASITTASPATGTIPALSLGNNTTSPWANQTNVTVLIQTVAGSLVLSQTGVATSAGGLLPATVSSLIAAGTTYRVIPIVDNGAEGSILVVAQ